MQLQDETGAVIATQDADSDNGSETIRFTRAKGATRYYIVCRSADWFSSGSGEYWLGLWGDPNDQMIEAIDLGDIVQTISRGSEIDSASDVDLFSLRVHAGQRLSFDIDNTSGLDAFIRLFDANGTQVAACSQRQRARPGPRRTPRAGSLPRVHVRECGHLLSGSVLRG